METEEEKRRESSISSVSFCRSPSVSLTGEADRWSRLDSRLAALLGRQRLHPLVERRSLQMHLTGSPVGSGTSPGVLRSWKAKLRAPSSAFGVPTSTPAFGSTASPLGSAAPAFSQKPAGAFGGFGTTPAQMNPFSNPFGQTQAACGSQPFASAPTGFGLTSSPAPGTPALLLPCIWHHFRIRPNDSSMWGEFHSSIQQHAIWSLFTSPLGAQTASTYGPASAPAFGASPVGAQRGGSRVSPFAVTDDPDFGIGGQVGKLMSISAMPAYSSKCPEELRWEDYQAGCKGGPGPTAQQPAAGSIFVQTAPTSPFGVSTGFGHQTSTVPNPFATAATTSIFEQKPATGFGATSAPAFAASSSPAFGTTFGQAPSTGAAFGQAGIPAFRMTPSPFGASGTTPFGFCIPVNVALMYISM
ncbi:hypothetical protein R1sor_024450 [Riccia sorocarpa]|uniref:Uncharacterized protein n=1 Tax=Riccia sorocarpa TaxID=122646 RepID=A0ABD3GSZ2_9MARC